MEARPTRAGTPRLNLTELADDLAWAARTLRATGLDREAAVLEARIQGWLGSGTSPAVTWGGVARLPGTPFELAQAVAAVSAAAAECWRQAPGPSASDDDPLRGRAERLESLARALIDEMARRAAGSEEPVAPVESISEVEPPDPSTPEVEAPVADLAGSDTETPVADLPTPDIEAPASALPSADIDAPAWVRPSRWAHALPSPAEPFRPAALTRRGPMPVLSPPPLGDEAPPTPAMPRRARRPQREIRTTSPAELAARAPREPRAGGSATGAWLRRGAVAAVVAAGLGFVVGLAGDRPASGRTVLIPPSGAVPTLEGSGDTVPLFADRWVGATGRFTRSRLVCGGGFKSFTDPSYHLHFHGSTLDVLEGATGFQVVVAFGPDGIGEGSAGQERFTDVRVAGRRMTFGYQFSFSGCSQPYRGAFSLAHAPQRIAAPVLAPTIGENVEVEPQTVVVGTGRAWPLAAGAAAGVALIALGGIAGLASRDDPRRAGEREDGARPHRGATWALVLIAAGGLLAGYSLGRRGPGPPRPAAPLTLGTGPCPGCPAGEHPASIEVQNRAKSVLFVLRGEWPGSADALGEDVRLVANQVEVVLRPHGSDGAFEIVAATVAGSPLSAGSVSAGIRRGALLIDVSADALSPPFQFETGLWSGTAYVVRVPTSGLLVWNGTGAPFPQG